MRHIVVALCIVTPWRGTLVPEGRALRLERDDRLYRGTLHRISHSG